MQNDAVNIYLAGDSTMQTYGQDAAPQAGWGQFIAEYFTGGVKFWNRAIGGRSSKTFVEEGRLEQILKAIGSGDYLFVQMGHNDATESKPERYTEPYTGYKQYLTMYVDGARKAGAVPVLITPVGRMHVENGRFLNDFEDYCRSMKQVADSQHAAFIDLMSASLKDYAAIGYDEALTLFMASVNGTDFTHFTKKGAARIARLVARGVRDLNMPISRLVLSERID